jgi:hypothetical protein
LLRLSAMISQYFTRMRPLTVFDWRLFVIRQTATARYNRKSRLDMMRALFQHPRPGGFLALACPLKD